MAAGPEVELKLRADDAALRDLAAVGTIGPATLLPPRTVDEVDVYLDTPDRRLAAARWACRLRTREGRTVLSLKGPAEHDVDDPWHRRPEMEGPAPRGDDASGPATAWPPSPARDLVVRLAGEASLAERLTLRQRRTERSVLVDGVPVGTLSLDRVTVEVGGATVGGFGVAELEVLPGRDTGWLHDVAQDLSARPGLEPDPLSKLQRAVQLAPGAAGAAG